MTAQIHERLIFDGERTSMASCPPLPEGHPRISETDPASLTLDDESGSILFSTACWRRYEGTWEVKDGQFFLIDLRGRLKLIGEGPLLADWFSGVIRIPRGNILHYVHMGFESVYEEDVYVRIESGRITNSWTVDHRSKKRGWG